MNPDEPRVSFQDLVSFVVEKAAKVTGDELGKLVPRLPDIRERAASLSVPGVPDFPAQILFLCDVVEDFATGRFDRLSLAAGGSCAFALMYLEKDVDLLPDFMEVSGLLDDAAVVRIVLERHADELRHHPGAARLHFGDEGGGAKA